MRLLLVLLGTAAAAAAPWPLEAQHLVPPDSFIVDVWTTEHGLPQNTINDIAQTPDGYLWLATNGGLVRFDGVRFELVPRTDSSRVQLDRIGHLRATPDGVLWLGTEGGLVRYVQGRFERIDLDGSHLQGIGGLAVASDGTVWASTGSGIYAYDGRSVHRADSPGGPMTFDARGALWLSRPGLYATPYRAVHGEPLTELEQPRGPEATFLGTDAAGANWFGSADRGRFTRIAGGKATRFEGKRGHVGRLLSVARDPHGSVWLASFSEGLFVMGADDRAQRVYMPRSHTVGKVFVDAQGVVWAGTTAAGLVRIRRSAFRVYSAPQGFRQQVAGAVLERRAGGMLFGSMCAGVFEKPADSELVRPLSWSRGLHDISCVTALAEDADGGLWIGGWGHLTIVRGDSSVLARMPDGSGVGNAVALHRGADGTMWVGRSGWGVVAFRRDGSVLTFRRGSGLQHEDVRLVTEDRNGTIWVGTVGGVGSFDGSGWRWYTTANGLGADYVRALYHAPDGSHWFGTYGGGLARLRDGHIVRVRKRDGLPENVVSAIVPDDGGNLWMSGNTGIFRVRLAQLDSVADGRLARVHSVLYGRADGLLETETNGGFHPAAWRSRDGRLWFPTLDGVAAIDPVAAAAVRPPPRTLVEEVLVNGVIHPWSGELRLPAGQPSLEVRYTGLGVAAPEDLRFRYRLTPYEQEWTAAGQRRIAYYPKLPPGRYRFEVSAASRAGAWNAPAVLPMHVRSALWEAWWFRALALAALAVAAVLLVRRRFATLERARAAQQHLARALIEEQERERRRIAGALHDGLGQDLLLAGNYANMALASDDADTAREHVVRVRQLSADALSSIRDLARTLAPRQLEHAGLRAALDGLVCSADEASDISFSCDIDAIDELLPPDARINVFRVVQEGVSNILRHADARTAHIRVAHDHDALVISIRDDGRGFRPASVRAAPGIGLGGIGERIGILGGTLEINAAPGAGTHLCARIPLRKVPLPT